MDLNQLLNKRLLMLTGKGGIGKSVTAASLGLLSASLGKKVCIVESAPRSQVAPLLGFGSVGHQIQAVNPNLSIVNLEAQLNFRDFVVQHLGFARLFEKVFTRKIVQSFIRMIPGISELTLLGRLFHLCELDKVNNLSRFDLVIFDGFASGHFESLMDSPDAILNSGLTGPVVDETRRVRDFLNNEEKCGVVMITNSEELVMSEALEFIPKRQAGLGGLDLVIINKVLPNLKEDMLETTASNYPNLMALVNWVGGRSIDQESQRSNFYQKLVSLGEIDCIELRDIGFIETLQLDDVRSWFGM